MTDLRRRVSRWNSLQMVARPLRRRRRHRRPRHPRPRPRVERQGGLRGRGTDRGFVVGKLRAGVQDRGRSTRSTRNTAPRPKRSAAGTRWCRQIKAAPADNPPFDVTVGEEFVSSSGMAEGIWLEQDRTKIPNLAAIY